MNELIRRIPNLFHKRIRSVEKTIVPQPSPFVLIQDDEPDKRLNTDEKIPLNPGPCDQKEQEDSKITSLVISPTLTYLILHVKHGQEYNRGEWGNLETNHHKTKKEGLTNSFTEGAFHQREGKRYLNGSSVYLDDVAKKLHGPGWVLEYRPLEKNS